MPPYPSEWLLAALAVGLRILFSAGEVALVRASRKTVRELDKRRQRPSTKALLHLLSDPEGSFATLRLGSMASLSAAAACGGSLALRIASTAGEVGSRPLLVVAGAIGAAAVAFLAEILPRTLAAAAPERWGLRLAPSLWLWKVPLTPLMRGIGWLLDRLLSPLGVRARFRVPDPAVEEAQRILAEAAGSGLDGPSREFLQSLMELPTLLAKDVLIPRTEVVALPASISPPDLVRIVAEAGHSRFPVYEGDIDTIVGILHTRDIVPLLSHPELILVTDLIRPAVFVPWALRLGKLLKQMQEEQLHLVMVSDEHGGFLGIVTLEDVLAKLMEGRRTRPRGQSMEHREDGSYLLDASTPLGRANALLETALPEDEGFDTLGGFLNQLAGTIPEQGVVLESHGMIFTVVERTATRVVRVQVSPSAQGADLGAA